MRAILLAGGKGTRLYPYTVSLPKPLVPIDDRPIIEIVLKQLKRAGFDTVTISIGHLAEIITAVIGDGSKYGVTIDYVRESVPLGTAGPMHLVRDLPENFLLMNGDILTDLDYSQLFRAHVASDAEVTIASYRKSVPIDLGVMKSRENLLYEYVEKPVESFDVSMGIYIMRKSVLDLIPEGRRFDFPTLVQSLLAAKRKVRLYPFAGRWLDIGRPADFEEAQETFRKERVIYLPGEDFPKESGKK